jgi:hypothetical protein
MNILWNEEEQKYDELEELNIGDVFYLLDDPKDDHPAYMVLDRSQMEQLGVKFPKGTVGNDVPVVRLENGEVRFYESTEKVQRLSHTLTIRV